MRLSRESGHQTFDHRRTGLPGSTRKQARRGAGLSAGCQGPQQSLAGLGLAARLAALTPEAREALRGALGGSSDSQ